ncbi:signal peptidase II [Fictibacillus sp. S7]|nr:signal peptidase II [Fictibacillus sp. S7]
MFYFGAFIALALDQIIKLLVRRNVNVGESISIVRDFIYITPHRNPGAALGIFAGHRWFLTFLTLAIVMIVIYVVKKGNNRLLRIGGALFIGGALGNVLDRIYFGQVFDFLNVRIINYHIFNTADVELIFGVGIIVLVTSLRDTKGKHL